MSLGFHLPRAGGVGATALEPPGTPPEEATAVLEPPAATPAPAHRAARHRRDRRHGWAWDLLGLSLTALAMLGVHNVASSAIGTTLGHPPAVRSLTVATAGVSALLFVVLVISDRPRPRELPGLVARAWAAPSGPWVAFPLGALLAIPLLSLYTPVLLRDADSARIVAAVTHVQAHGIDFILDTQDNILPHLVIGPAVAIAGLAGAKVVAIVSVQVLAGVTCYVTRRITGSMLGGVAATVALLALPPVVDRAGYLPMYPAMLALAYFGAWLSAQAITEPDHRWRRAAAAGICLALAPEAQAVGLLFLVAPVLLLVLAPSARSGLAACCRIYLVAGLASLPRLAVNLSVGGTERLSSYRTDYWITEGYVSEIQSNFWAYRGIDEPLDLYLGKLPGRFVHTLEPQGWIVLGVALLAWLLACRVRGRLIVLGATGFMVLAVALKQVPPFPRYYSPLWPGIAVLAGVGVAALARRRLWAPRVLAVLAVPALAAVAASSLVATAHDQDSLRAVVDDGPYRELAALVDDGRGVIGARSHALVNVTASTPTWGGQFLTEDEYVTYLTWPSDDAVVEVMERHDIGWVLVNPNIQLETEYHDTWLVPHHGRTARHVEQLPVSPAFCRVAEIDGFVLYRLGGCPARSVGGTGATTAAPPVPPAPRAPAAAAP